MRVWKKPSGPTQYAWTALSSDRINDVHISYFISGKQYQWLETVVNDRAMIIKVYARRGGVTRLQLLGPLTASIYTTQVYSNVLRDHMAGLPIPTLSPIENILALRSHMRGSIFQHSPASPHILSTIHIANSIFSSLTTLADSFFTCGHSFR